jgi:hypothetical protein
MHLLSTPKTFLICRWQGKAPLRTVFWRDMLLVGTALNILTGIAAVVLLTFGVSTAIALAVHFGLLPWNLFLCLAVWRSAENISPFEALVARVVAGIWLAAVIVI